LKTKDDPEMLLGWIEHHSLIVGARGLIVFDNGSSDEVVEAIYHKYGSEILIVAYSGFHNHVHDTKYFPELYDALRASCEHFVFLDTDERLNMFDGDRHFTRGPSLVDFLGENTYLDVFPGTWLQNVTGFSDRFSFYDPIVPLKHGLKWGKPIISAASAFDSMINHNTQVPHGLYDAGVKTNIFVFHLSKVSKAQRIKANLRKLKVYGVLQTAGGITEFLALKPEDLARPQVTMYASEIYQLMDPSTPERGAVSNSIWVSETGEITFSAEWQKAALIKFINEPGAYTSDLLST
jgi:hypothetical protein